MNYIKDNYDIQYSLAGTVKLLHRLGFVYKLTKVYPEQADLKKQIEFLENYRKLKSSKNKEDKILFMDGVHPHYNSKVSRCWVMRGEEKNVPAKTGRKRINLNGALNVEEQEIIIREDKTINADSTIALFE
jgi:hypothetical protein